MVIHYVSGCPFTCKDIVKVPSYVIVGFHAVVDVTVVAIIHYIRS